jgi:hypothetical protein
MTKRTTKQIIIGLIFFLILSGIGFLIYYSSRPAPSCTDGIQNQGEERIDCGGPCSPCELIYIKEIEVLWAKALSGQGNFYDLAAQIKNPNQNYGSGQVPYQFELYDAQNNLIAKYAGLTFILPNQTKYLLQVKAESSKPVKKVKLSFGQIKWQKPEDYQPPQLSIQQKEYRLLSNQEPGFAQVRAILVNKSNFDFDKVDIDILLFDSTHRLLALNTNEIRTLLAGQERDFVATWFNQIKGQVAFVEIEAETNIFDPDNYLSGGREKERFQEY